MMLQMIRKNALQLGFVAVICVAILGITNLLTQPRIQQQELANKLATLKEVLPQLSNSNTLLSDCIQVTDQVYLGRSTPQTIYRWREEGKVLAYIIETTAPDGYSGNIDLIVAVAPDGTIQGSRVLRHLETPGLGDKIEIRKADWILNFDQQQATEDNGQRWAVRKEGGQFDQFTGATITPRAVINAIRKAALYVRHHPELADIAANCKE